MLSHAGGGVNGLFGASGVDVIGPHEENGACGGQNCTGLRYLASDGETGRVFKLEKPVELPTGDHPQTAAVVTVKGPLDDETGITPILSQQVWAACGKDGEVNIFH